MNVCFTSIFQQDLKFLNIKFIYIYIYIFNPVTSLWRNCSIQIELYCSAISLADSKIMHRTICYNVCIIFLFFFFFNGTLLWPTMVKTLPKLSIWHHHKVPDSLGGSFKFTLIPLPENMIKQIIPPTRM